MKTALFLFLSVLALLANGLSEASSSAHASPAKMTTDFYFTVANFLTMILVLYFVLRKSIQSFFRARATNTKLEMEKIKKIYNEAYRKYEEVESRLKNADLDGKKLLDSLKHEGELEKQRIIRKARETSHQIKFDAERVIKQELLKAKEGLRLETAELATRLATQKIQQTLTSADQDQLSTEFLENLSSIKKVS